MKMRTILAAAAVFTGMVGTSFAFEGSLATRMQGLVTTVSCDVRDAYTDKQAACASACDDQFIRDKQKLELNLPKATEDKKACDAKCGCPQNSN